MSIKPLTEKEIKAHITGCFIHAKTCKLCNLFLLKTLEAVNFHRLQETKGK